VITIENYASYLAYYNFTFDKGPLYNVWRHISRNPTERLPVDLTKYLGIDYDLDSDEELGEMLGDDVDKESSSEYYSEGNDDSEMNDFIVNDDEVYDEDQNVVKERRERINVLEQRKRFMFSLGEQMKPTITYQDDIGPEYTAVSFMRLNNQAVTFPLKPDEFEKPEILPANVKDVML
jgi:hypothetical protein